MKRPNIILIMKNKIPSFNPFRAVFLNSFSYIRIKILIQSIQYSMASLFQIKDFFVFSKDKLKKDTINDINHTKKPYKIPIFHFIIIITFLSLIYSFKYRKFT